MAIAPPGSAGCCEGGALTFRFALLLRVAALAPNFGRQTLHLSRQARAR